MTNILFICKANRFRSKIAETYFKKINKDKRNHVKSAGVLSGWPMISRKTKEILRKDFGLIIKGKPKPITRSLVKWANIIVIVANNVSPDIFNEREFKGKLIVWKVQDARKHTPKEIKRVARTVIAHINKFIKTL